MIAKIYLKIIRITSTFLSPSKSLTGFSLLESYLQPHWSGVMGNLVSKKTIPGNAVPRVKNEALN